MLASLHHCPPEQIDSDAAATSTWILICLRASRALASEARQDHKPQLEPIQVRCSHRQLCLPVSARDAVRALSLQAMRAWALQTARLHPWDLTVGVSWTDCAVSCRHASGDSDAWWLSLGPGYPTTIHSAESAHSDQLQCRLWSVCPSSFQKPFAEICSLQIAMFPKFHLWISKVVFQTIQYSHKPALKHLWSLHQNLFSAHKNDNIHSNYVLATAKAGQNFTKAAKKEFSINK